MRRIIIGVICLALILPGFFAFARAEETAPADLPYEPDSLLVKLSVRSGGLMTMDLKEPNFSRYGDMEWLLTLKGEPKSGLQTFFNRGEQTAWYALTLREGQDLEETKAALEQEAGVLAVTYNFRIKTLSDGVDPLPAETRDAAASEPQQWHLEACGLPEAKTYLEENGFPSGGGSNIIVAVLDTGVDYTHPDLKDNILRDKDGSIIGEDTTRDDTSDPMPDAGQENGGHGTHCAGIIAASGKQYVRGVADNIKIMPVKVLNKEVGNQVTMLKGIQFARKHGAHIVSMSIGMPVTETVEYDKKGNQLTYDRVRWENNGYNSALHDAIREYSNDMIFIASAGNDGRPNEDIGGANYLWTYPAAWPEVIAVMSVDQAQDENGDWLSDFSNWDVTLGCEPEYNIAAPGEKILSTVPWDPSKPLGPPPSSPSSPPSNGYAYMQGTSMATPYVAGCAALLLTKYIDNNDFTIQDVKRILLENVDIKQGKTFDGSAYTCPVVNIDKALSYREPVEVELPAYIYVQQESGTSSNAQLPSEQNGRRIAYYYSNATYQGNVAPTKPGTYTLEATVDSIYYEGEAQGLYTVYEDAGDFNGDGKIDREDVKVYRRHQFGVADADGVLGSRYVEALDYNHDGVINLLDFTWMRMLEKRRTQTE